MTRHIIQIIFLWRAKFLKILKPVVQAPIPTQCQCHLGVSVFGGQRNLTTLVICRELESPYTLGLQVVESVSPLYIPIPPV